MLVLVKGVVKKPPKNKPLPRHAHRSPPEGYPKSKEDYAIPEEFKYPLKPKSRWYAALRYFSKPENYRYYTPEERKRIIRRIISYGKKHYGIEVSDDVKEKFGLKKAFGDPAEVLKKTVNEFLSEGKEEK